MKNLPTITYLVLAHNEKNLDSLLNLLRANKSPEDQILVLDDYSNEETQAIFKKHGVRVVQHKLEHDYSAHRNYALQFCRCNYIFAIDGDELPHEELLVNVKQIIQKLNRPDVICIPRVNIFKGVKPIHALQYGWDLKGERVNYLRGDPQTRLFKRSIGLKWKGVLHERIAYTEKNTVKGLPQDDRLSLFHFKTIEEQIASNNRYNKEYSVQENMGISLDNFKNYEQTKN